jgi:hypothetical protein
MILLNEVARFGALGGMAVLDLGAVMYSIGRNKRGTIQEIGGGMVVGASILFALILVGMLV